MENKAIRALTYKDSGVDIDAGNTLVERIKPLAKATSRPGMSGGPGGFGALFDLKAAGYQDPVLVSCTDGVGTKLKLAFATGLHHTVGIDLVAMSVNDLVVQGAEPLFFLDYFACGRLHVDVAADVIAGIARGCEQAGCALIGGESAEMPGMYADGEYDLAGFAVGAGERGYLLDGAAVSTGDVIIGLGSGGVHSNGFSLLRNVMEVTGIGLDAPAPFDPGKTLGAALLEPTKIYVKSCLAAHKAGLVKAMAHITGGGLPENLPRVLPGGTVARLDATAWNIPPVFDWVQSGGNIEAAEMLRSFNCGIGMAVVVAKQKAQAALSLFKQYGETATLIGDIHKHSGEAAHVVVEGIKNAWHG